MDENVINRLYSLCNRRRDLVSVATIYGETIDLAKEKELDNDLKKKLFVELYRYSFYESGLLGLDPRGVHGMRAAVISNVKDALENGAVNEEVVDKLKSGNDLFRAYVDSPIKEIEDEIKFHQENPNVKF